MGIPQPFIFSRTNPQPIEDSMVFNTPQDFQDHIASGLAYPGQTCVVFDGGNVGTYYKLNADLTYEEIETGSLPDGLISSPDKSIEKMVHLTYLEFDELRTLNQLDEKTIYSVEGDPADDLTGTGGGFGGTGGISISDVVDNLDQLISNDFGNILELGADDRLYSPAPNIPNVNAMVSDHNTDNQAHQDIRSLIDALELFGRDLGTYDSYQTGIGTTVPTNTTGFAPLTSISVGDFIKINTDEDIGTPSIRSILSIDGSNNILWSSPFGLANDTTDKANKITSPTTGNLVSQKPDGDIEDSGFNVTDFQETLVSGTNIKSINGESLLGSGNINISGGGGFGSSDISMSDLINHNSNSSAHSTQFLGKLDAIHATDTSAHVTLFSTKLGVNDTAADSAKLNNLDPTEYMRSPAAQTADTMLLVASSNKGGTPALKPIADFQEKLVNSTNIKSINGISLLGSGDIDVPGANMVWCDGYFANRSVAVGSSVILTPVHQNGTNMVSGTTLVMPSTGVYAFTINGGYATPSTANKIILWVAKNHSTGASTANMLAHNIYNSMGSSVTDGAIPSLNFVSRLLAGDALTIYIVVSVALTGIQELATLKYSLSRIA